MKSINTFMHCCGQEAEDREHFTEDVATRCNAAKNPPFRIHRQCCLPSTTTRVPALRGWNVSTAGGKSTKSIIKRGIYAKENVRSYLKADPVHLSRKRGRHYWRV